MGRIGFRDIHLRSSNRAVFQCSAMVGPLVYELYGPRTSGKAETAMRFRGAEWAGLRFLAAVRRSCPRIYALAAPSFQNLRGQMVLTKADLESIVDRDINKLSKRLTQLEEDHAVTADGLHRMKQI